LVTGAGIGIGLAIAKALVAAGASTVFHYNTAREQLDQTIESLTGDGRKVVGVQRDLSSLSTARA
jgi:NAD(P)-dependent dehydrogenase (short-subunit alcohol dehydrogenase family)